MTQWLEAVERDYSHPCIVGWCPLNETRQQLHNQITVLDDVTRGMFLATNTVRQHRPRRHTVVSAVPGPTVLLQRVRTATSN